MSIITDAKHKKKLLKTMGPSSGGLFYQIHNQVSFLRNKSAEFSRSYSKNELSIDVLNSLYEDSFDKLQIIIKEDLNLALSFLLERTKNTAFSKFIFKLQHKQIYDLSKILLS